MDCNPERCLSERNELMAERIQLLARHRSDLTQALAMLAEAVHEEKEHKPMSKRLVSLDGALRIADEALVRASKEI